MGCALGHMCPKYASDYLDGEMVAQMVKKTVPRPRGALIDWKGLKGETRGRILEWLEDLGVEPIKA